MIKRIQGLPKSLKILLFIVVLISGAYISSLVFVYSASSGDLTSTSLNKGLIAHWSLDIDHYNASDNRVSDSTPYVNHGTNNGAIFVEDRHGNQNSAMRFNRTTRPRISFSPITFNNAVPYAGSMWIKIEDGIAGSPLGGFGWSDFITLTATSFQYRPGGGSAQTIATFSSIDDDNWHLVTWNVESNRTVSVYIDGEFEGSSVLSDTNIYYDSIGNGYVDHPDYNLAWNGLIDDVRLYNRTLSTDEIELLYDSYIPKAISGSLQRGLILDMPLTSNWTKNESSGSEIMTDKTPYSHDGQNYGSTLSDGSVSMDSNLEPLMMDYRVWKDGQTGSVGEFVGIYSASNHSRIIAEDPWGREVPVWKGVPNAGIYHNAQAIDNTKLYRMSWWEKRVTNAAATYGRYYAGLNGYGSVDGIISLSGGAYNVNPYFLWMNHSDLIEGQWFLVVGHIFPYTHSGTTRHPDSKVYTVDGFLRDNNYNDYKWAPETTSARSRNLAIYLGDDPNIVHYTVYPRMEVVDGTEPSIQDLLNGHDSYGQNIMVTVPEDKVTVSFWYDDADSDGWVHVVNSSGTFYVNGELGTPDKYPIVINGDNVYIGRTTMSDYFLGTISHLKIYNRALSSTEVQSLYSQGRGETGIILGGS